jgi:hypothetical protein
MMDGRLEKMRELQVGWDSYDADVPNDVAFRAAQECLDEMSRVGMEPLAVVPTAEGGVAIIFMITGDYYADVECFNDGENVAITSPPGDEQAEVWHVKCWADTLTRVRTFTGLVGA